MIKPILLSFRENDKERKLSTYTRNKSCMASWIKDAMFEKMEKEEDSKKVKLPQKQTGIQFREDIM